MIRSKDGSYVFDTELKTPNDFLEKYKWACNNQSDIFQHVKTLFELGLETNHITEMGVRTGNSTSAFLNLAVNHDKILISFDYKEDATVKSWFESARQLEKNANYVIANTLMIDIQPTDLLFIDTEHTYEQLKTELSLHGNKAKKYIVLHDTTTVPDLNLAINEFLAKNKHWKIKKVYTHNNGLTVLERTNG